MKEKFDMNTKRTFKEIEKQVILERIYSENGNMVNTAKSLAIGLRTLHRKLRSYGYKSRSSGRPAQQEAVAFAKGWIVC
jgi:DNA-binding NtrC family response regulator